MNYYTSYNLTANEKPKMGKRKRVWSIESECTSDKENAGKSEFHVE